jgi:hypothetical protein
MIRKPASIDLIRAASAASVHYYYSPEAGPS